MKRLLFIGQFPPPKHGVSIINKLLCDDLKSNYTVIKYDYRFSDDLKDIGGRLLYKLITYIRHCQALLCIILLSKRFDIIYFTPNIRGGVFFRDLVVVFILKFSRSKLFLHLHGLGINDRSRSRFWRFCYYLMFSNTYVIHVSEKVVKDEFNYCYGSNKRFFLNNSVDICLAQEFCDMENAVYSGKTIVHMSNFRPSKGVMDVLNVYKELKKEVPCRLKMVGSFTSNRFETEVFDYINKEKLDDIEFLGFLEAEEKNNVLAEADLFLYPSYDDSFGLVVLEAQVFGTPIVAYDIGSMTQIVNHKYGFVAKLGDFDSFLSASRRLLVSPRNSPDMGFLKDYDITSYSNRLVDLLENTN